MLTYGPQCCPGGITGYGNLSSKIVFVGISPAFNEMQVGRPLVGPSGKLLDQALNAVGLSRDLIYATNLCCTWNNNPSMEMINKCRPRLLSEIKDAVLVVALGGLACEQLCGMRISKCRGFMIRIGPGQFGMATWHPSALLQSNDEPNKQNDLSAELIRDLKKVKLFYRDNPPRMLVPPEVTKAPEIIYDSIRAQTILDSLPRDTFVTLDIETPIGDKDDRLADPYHEILCVGIGLADDTQYVFHQSILGQLVFPKDVKYGGWNLYGFDCVALKQKYNIDIEVSHDGMLTSYVRDERTKYGTHKLKHNSREHAGAGFWEDEDTRQDFLSLAKYNGLDCAYNHRVLRYHLNSFDSDDKRLYYDLLIPAANMLSESQYDGVTVDKWRLLELACKLYSRITGLHETLTEIASDYGFQGHINLDSNQQVSHFLFNVLKINPLEYSHQTKGGAWSVDKNVLDAIPHEWCDLLRKFRQATDTMSRYIENPLRQIKYDSRVHPKAWIPGTVTGRLSYSDPPVQQLPHAKTIGELSEVRSIFTVDSEDYTLIEADYSQGELWIMYGHSGDQNLYADLTEPWYATGIPDYHSRTCEHGIPCLEHINTPAGELAGCPVCVKWAFDRDGQKHVNFGIPYGETAHGLTRPPPIGTGLPLKTNQELINKWYKRNTDFRRLQIDIEKQIRQTGIVKNSFGRKRRFPLVLNAKQIRQGINAPIQGDLGDYTLSSAIELWPLLKQYDTRLLWITHDSGLWHVPLRYLDTVKALIKEVMEKPRVPGMPSIKVDIHTGQNLYEVKS